MTLTELDLIVDNASETAFPYLYELDNTNEYTDIELKDALAEEYGYSDMLAARIVDAWMCERNEKLNHAIKETPQVFQKSLKELSNE